MATSIATISGNNVPAHIKARMNAASTVSDTLSDGLYGEAYNRISIRQAKFRIMLNGDEHKVNRDTLDVVIVGANPGRAKQFYLKPYNAEAAEGPDTITRTGSPTNSRMKPTKPSSGVSNGRLPASGNWRLWQSLTPWRLTAALYPGPRSIISPLSGNWNCFPGAGSWSQSAI